MGVVAVSVRCPVGGRQQAPTLVEPQRLGRHAGGDALNAEGCLRIYKDTATGTRADRPQWILCLDNLRPGDTLVIWKIDRLGRNLRDLIDIVTTLDARG
ncbi:recombinase family protein, partial [Pseudarthrobacter sp. MDT3-26]|uniref:recombinase family protein n=1 Tax=Pseudarthrobacter raffinosi TaxID=2953651 RepID=UPI00208F0043